MWPDLIQKSKDGGLDVIETYVFWNAHEPVRGQVMTVLFSFFFILILHSPMASGISIAFVEAWNV